MHNQLCIMWFYFKALMAITDYELLFCYNGFLLLLL